MNNDLALQGTVDGVELLIFPSNLLPKNSQCWNDMFFLWSVFRGQRGNNSKSTAMINSLELKNGDAVKNWPFDLNACPEGGDGMAKLDGISKFQLLRDTVLVGDDNSSKGDKANEGCIVIDANTSPWPESEMHEKGLVGIEDDNVEVPPSSQLSTTLNPIQWEIVDALIFLSMGKS
ncbi:unnamed protein product [Sphenostylis stenocarpa]|uniref:AIPP2-like SPOC-like domain-containing protein n=1 Tax=Sphenostylis stenocarpa TaxID=92480 RepID=A0AA86VCY8_9FABA|nr:unnamed protein product [Sphenostylis stenocarpa]